MMPVDKKTGKMQPPKNQKFDRGFTITINTTSGRKTARFQHADELAIWFDQNKIVKEKKRNYDPRKN